jgi:predicted  nucleic acid-binding Zn-ribbon protein
MAKVKDPAELNVEDKLRNLYQLQTLMTEIDQIKTLRGELPLEVKDLEDEIAGLETRIEKINEDIASAKKDINERQGIIEKNKMDIERFENQMKNVRNNREYENFSKQIEFLRLDNELHQKRIGEAKDALERRSDELIKSNQVIADRRTDLDIKRSELEEIVSETKAEEEKLKETAHNVEVTIEPRLLSAFKRIRKNSRNGLAVVYVQRDSCGGCFNKVPPQRQLDIRTRKKIIVCEYCGRILVDPELAGVKMDKQAQEEKPRRRRVLKRRED